MGLVSSHTLKFFCKKQKLWEKSPSQVAERTKVEILVGQFNQPPTQPIGGRVASCGAGGRQGPRLAETTWGRHLYHLSVCFSHWQAEYKVAYQWLVQVVIRICQVTHQWVPGDPWLWPSSANTEAPPSCVVSEHTRGGRVSLGVWADLRLQV